MGTKFWPMNRNRSYTHIVFDEMDRIISCKTNCSQCNGRFFSGKDINTGNQVQCRCVNFEDIGVSIAGNVTLTRKDN